VQKGQAALIGRKRDKLLLIGRKRDKLLLIGCKRDKLLLIGCKRDKLLLIGCKRDKLLLITIQMKREQDGLYRGVRHMSRLEVGLGEWTSMWISLIRHVCTYITGHTTVLSITGGF
jgi:hypothetical protein